MCDPVTGFLSALSWPRNRTTVRLVTLMALLGVIAGSSGAHATTTRRVTVEYTLAGGSVGVVGASPTVMGQRSNDVVAPTRSKERSVHVEILDALGRPVAAVVSQFVGADGHVRELGRFCGRTSKPIKLATTSADVHVTLLAGNACATASTPTKGSVTMTFAR